MLIRVLVVDDDNLVRRGLISSMPWASFGMQVVGEAANGEKALEFLAANQVELLLTDLAMPVMSGIELIRIVRERYPDLAVAVLTLHQDFEYIQEALRMGVIDYIAKIQLEIEKFEEVLGRIRARIVERRQNREEEGMPVTSDVCMDDDVYALLAIQDLTDPSSIRTVADSAGNWGAGVDPQVWMWLWAKSDSLIASVVEAVRVPPYPDGMDRSAWRMIHIRNAAGESRSAMEQRLAQYRQQELFYACDGTESDPIELSLQQLSEEQPAPGQEDIELARVSLHSFRWLQDEASFNDLIIQLRDLRLRIPTLIQLLYGCTVDWNRIYRTVNLAHITLPQRFYTWQEAISWLADFRQTALSISGRLQLSPEVSGSIMAAIRIVHDELEQPVFAIEVARRVNLSRSYFNQCFKELVGCSFNEFLRKARMDKAREYLEKTSYPIQWVAEHTGYADDKYFSRSFREQTGMLPSEYRQRHRQG
ncbi:two-component system response regulator YesN [Paenibacillus phyllosphaerae]|uniref:Two-component system response regulator YesN n=1 Tax=Paenibacillus phyllosphaerae TaxID=274593 RepID=A0A7W5B3N2_9BACL|nr:helix-turn-helix domain-containing protein [Paenibacillus phyllosphaerae]MBB3113091.1 two-component system response regulator YesN [Paenibacillus phyllosphaerae]